MWVDVIFGVVLSLILFYFLGFMAWMLDLALLLSVFDKNSKTTGGLWQALLAPGATAGVIALTYVVLADEAKILNFSGTKRFLLSAALVFAIVAGFIGTTQFFSYPMNRKNWLCWMFVGLDVSVSIVALRQIKKLMYRNSA